MSDLPRDPDPFVGRSDLLALADQLVAVAGGKWVAPAETRPVLVVEGVGGSGRSALLRQICARWAGKTPTVLVPPLSDQGEDTIWPVLTAVMLGLSAPVPGFKVTFPRVLLARIAMDDPAVDSDPELAVGEMIGRLRVYREPRALVQLIGDLMRTVGRFGHTDAITQSLADNLADSLVERLRGSRWLAKLSWQEALTWFGQNSQTGNTDPMRALVTLNQKARSTKSAVIDQSNAQLVRALLADLRHGMAHGRGRRTNLVVLLDDGDAPSATTFMSSLLRARQATADDPLVLITVSGGMLGQQLAASVTYSLHEHESQLFNRPELTGAEPLLRVSSADLSPADVLELTQSFEWPTELAPTVTSDAVHRLTFGHPEATMLLLRKLAREPELVDDLCAVLRSAGPEQHPVEKYLLRQIVRALSPHRRHSEALLGMLVTISAGRDRLEAQSLSPLLKSSHGDRDRLFNSPVLWSHPGPSLHPFVRYLCLRALSARGRTNPAGWSRVFTMLRAKVAPDDVAGRLHHDLALAETREQTDAVVRELETLLPRIPAEDWLALLDAVVATPNPQRAGQVAELFEGSVARLLELLHLLSDRCLSDRNTLCDFYQLAAHDCRQLANSSRDALKLIRRAAEYDHLAGPLQ